MLCLESWENPSMLAVNSRPKLTTPVNEQGNPMLRQFTECKIKVLNRGIPPDAFLNELVDWKWQAGVDTTNPDSKTPCTEEAGIFQCSGNSMSFDPSLKAPSRKRLEE